VGLKGQGNAAADRVAAEAPSRPARAAERSETRILFGAWLALGLLALALAARGLSAPGLYYDEVIQAEATREFLDANGTPLRIPGASSVQFFGRWLPLFTQPYMGALKSQLLIPSFAAFGASGTVLRVTTWGGFIALAVLSPTACRASAALVASALLAVDPSFLCVSRRLGSFSSPLLLRAPVSPVRDRLGPAPHAAPPVGAGIC
jgi:hypothetical protein